VVTGFSVWTTGSSSERIRGNKELGASGRKRRVEYKLTGLTTDFEMERPVLCTRRSFETTRRSPGAVLRADLSANGVDISTKIGQY
jgi:hypothetical protein